MIRLIFMAGLAVIGTAGVSEAHTFGAHGAGFAHGFVHPFGGLDHLLAMLGVGLWAGLMGRSAAWKLPAAFIAMMAVGGAVAMTGLTLPFTEAGIALSVLIVGLAIMLSWTGMPVAGIVVAGFFALFHGFAHGTEMPQTAHPALYAMGFVAATALLHLSGVALALTIERAGEAGSRWIRLAGGTMAVTALVLLAGF